MPGLGHVFPAHQLPRVGPSAIVRLISGPGPRLPCNFTSVLRLEEIRQSEVIVACAMKGGYQPVLLEMDVASSFGLVPLVSPDVRKSHVYQRLMQFCVMQAESWRAQIKIAQPVMPPAQDTKSVFGRKQTSRQGKQSQAAYISVRCEANDGSLASRSSLKSKKSSASSSSVVSILSRLFVRSKKFRTGESNVHPLNERKPPPPPLPPPPLLPPPSTEDHFYETIVEEKEDNKKQQWESLWGEDGYVVTTSQAVKASRSLQPMYDVVC